MDRREFNRRQTPQKTTNLNKDLTPSELRSKIPLIKDLVKSKSIEWIIYYDRVSRRDKSRKKLLRRLNTIEKILKFYNIKIYRIFLEQHSGYTSQLDNRVELKSAVNLSSTTNIPIITPSISRYLRNEYFNTISNPKASPTREELNKFLQFCMGVQLCVLCDKEITTEEESEYLLELSRSSGEYSWKRYCQILRDQGYTYRHISKEISHLTGRSVSHITIINWVNEVGKGV